MTFGRYNVDAAGCGLELHDRVDVRHAAVSLENHERHRSRRSSRVEDLGALERSRLLDGAGDVALLT